MAANNDSRDPSTARWHLDRRIPLALLATIFFQTCVVGVWVGSIQARVAAVEENQKKGSVKLEDLSKHRLGTVERLATLEESSRSIHAILEGIDKKLDWLTNRYDSEKAR